MKKRLLFTAGKFLAGLYLGQAAIASTFGAAGSFVVLLIWVYYSALISFFGAEFTQVYARRYGSSIRMDHLRRCKNASGELIGWDGISEGAAILRFLLLVVAYVAGLPLVGMTTFNRDSFDETQTD